VEKEIGSMISRRRFLVTSAGCAASLPLSGLFRFVRGDDIPPALANAKAQFYLFLRSIVEAEGMTRAQNIVLNSTILPLDIAADTPFYNDELFREYADRTFIGGVEGLQANSAAFLAERFSSQYRAVMNIVTAQIDQNHPEIRNSLEELRLQQKQATQALTAKLNDFDVEWARIATSRSLQPDTIAYNMQYATWLGQVRYSDQIQSYTDDLDGINAQIDAIRRKVYSASEVAALDNYGNLSRAYNVARPWTANVERSYKSGGTPLTELLLADPRNWAPAMFDSSPLVFPVGDLIAFLSASGTHSFDTSSASYHLDSTQTSWNASGGGSFLGWSLGGSGGGSSSITHSMSKLHSLSISFRNVSEYLADRSAWFNPGVLQDPSILKLVKDRPELNKLQYIAVSLIIARGTKLVLKFSEGVTASDWSTSSFSANGGCSFLGCSFGLGGGGSKTSYTVDTSDNGTTVTIEDGEKVTRVLGARVEPFLQTVSQQPPQALHLLFKGEPSLKLDIGAVQSGKMSYLDFQKRRLEVQKKLIPQQR
jgi:hypothetical protein